MKVDEAESHSRSASGRWTPPPGCRNHAEYAIDTAHFFPWGPPSSIGEVFSAESNIPAAGPPSLLKPFLLAAGVSLATYLVLGEGLQLFPSKADPAILRRMAAALSVLTGGLTLAWAWPAPLWCTYIGKHGAAYFTGRWGQPAPGESQVLLFRDAAALFSSATHFYKNFIYQNTMFCFEWHNDLHGPPMMKIADEHNYHNTLPPPEHLFHFALRLEEVWTEELIARLGPDLPADRTLSFPCRKPALTDMLAGAANPNKMREIRLNRRELQFVYDGRIESLALHELGDFQAKRGVLKFAQHDASWFSRQGKFRIDYQHLGNAKAFLHYLLMAVASL